MFSLFSHAHKLLDKITLRYLHIADSIASLYCTSAARKRHVYYQHHCDFHDNVVSWTSKISYLIRQNQPEKAIGLFKVMLLSDQRPNFVTLVSVIRALGAYNCQNKIRVAHGLVIKLGFELEASVLTVLLGYYSGFDIGVALKLFDQVPNKDDVVLWTAMVSALVKNGMYGESIDCFRRMWHHGVEANDVSVVSVLPACAYVGELGFGKGIHGFLIKRGFYFFTNVRNALLDMYAKCGELEGSVRVFYGIWKKDLVSWRTMICGCIENECPKSGLNIFLKMQYSGFEPDEIIIRNVIVATIQAEELKFGLGLHSFIMKNGFLGFVPVGTALLQMFGKFGEFHSAQIVFDELNHKDLVAWSGLISVYAQGGQPHNAVRAFIDMQSTNLKPNEVTFVSLLRACSTMVAEELGQSIHGFVTKVGYSSNAYLKSALIDLYCKIGRIKEGRAVFDEISNKDLICWSSMVKGYGLNGYGLEALRTFSNMLDCGIKPNDVVFLSVLSACSQCGLENEGFDLLYSMEEKYRITPKLAHYACMVDLLSRQGNVEEALDFVKRMPVEPDKRIWGALLAGCKSRRNRSIVVAEFVVNELSALEPENTSYYMTLMDLYAEDGRWVDVDRLKKLIDDKRLKRTECSL